MGTVLWILIYAGLFYFMMRYGCCGGLMSHGRHARRNSERADPVHVGHGTHSEADTSVMRDAVCGMTVGSDDAYSRIYRGREYRFCSRNCLDQFESDPDRYAIEERLAS
jgi:YHS domain-containing protein